MLLVGVGPCQGGHAVAQHHVGKVKHLLHLEHAVRTPAHVVICRDNVQLGQIVSFIKINQCILPKSARHNFSKPAVE